MNCLLQGPDQQFYCERRAHVRGFPKAARRYGRQHTKEYRDEYEGMSQLPHNYTNLLSYQLQAIIG